MITEIKYTGVPVLPRKFFANEGDTFPTSETQGTIPAGSELYVKNPTTKKITAGYMFDGTDWNQC